MKQKNLENKIIESNKLYREGIPNISDSEYDSLMDTLRKSFPKSKLLKSGVIETANSRKEKLPAKMFSLNKVKTVEELKTWIENKELNQDDVLVITPKYDGISLVDFKGEKAWTRGNGIVGQRSDDHISRLSVNKRGILDVLTYGEAIISKKNWKGKFEGKINPYSNEPYKVPRNTVAGFFNKKTAVEELGDIDYVRYGIHNKTISKVCQLELLNDGGKQVPYCTFIASEIGSVDFDALYKAWSVEYEIDGLVVDVDSPKLRKILGREENNNPAYARALKLDSWSCTKETKIIDYKFQISKQGKLKGTVKIDPIIIDNVEVKQATFNNAKFLFDWKLSVGRSITIKRSGDVIPKIVAVDGVIVPQRENYKSQKEYEQAYEQACNSIKSENITSLMDYLAICPCCEDQLKWDETLTELICSNRYCKEKQISKIVHFFKVLKFEDFGEASIAQLYHQLALYRVEDFYTGLTEKDLSVIDGWGEKSIKKFLHQIQTTTPTAAQLLHALDDSEGKVGSKDFQNILDNLSDDDATSLMLGEFDDISKLEKIKGVSTKTAHSVIKATKKSIKRIELMGISVAYIQSPKKEVLSNKYKGWNVCMSGFRSEEVKNKIISGGGSICSGVSKKTTHLIVKDKSKVTSKMQKAENLNVKVLDIEEFEKI